MVNVPMAQASELWTAADMALWQGRSDAGERGDTRRLFNIAAALNPFDETPLPAAARALLGFACDAGVQRNQGRTGAAQGPQAIRRMLAGLPVHDHEALYDAGDVSCQGDALEAAQHALARTVQAVLARGGFPVVLGGGHEIAWGTWQGLRGHLDASGDPGSVLVLNLDAHFDLRTARPGSSGTPFDQIATACQARGQTFHYACLGVSRLGNTAALFARADELQACWIEDIDMQERHLEKVLEQVQQVIDGVDHVYLTIDLDVLPAAVMPAVSAPAAYGVPMGVVEAIVDRVRRSGKLRVADLAEFNPRFDQDSHGARAAARLVYRLLQA
ncbi:formimidoylglutamase [Comamonas sp. 4034]|uniref:formimidoylglutamase n=1 Tax=Comamonas sp. 4034 TaxID=3156455 RepID=UPI003D2351F7